MKATWRTTADEPASAALRRLHEEATPGPCPCKVTYDEHDDEYDCAVHGFAGRQTCIEKSKWIAGRDAGVAARNEVIGRALPALADLVAAVEHEVPHEREPGHFCGSPLCRALAAVHAALEAK